jgi:hypothetical protein
MSLRRWLCVYAVVLGASSLPAIEPGPPVPTTPSPSVRGPVLLPVPELPPASSESESRCPVREPLIEYDRSRLYLPDSIPETATTRGPVAADPETLRTWLYGGLFLGWSAGDSGGPQLAGLPGEPMPADLGSRTFEGAFRPGFRFDGGFWLNQPRTWGVEAGTLYLPQAGDQAVYGTAGPWTLAFPVVRGIGQPWTAEPFAGRGQPGLWSMNWSSLFVTTDIAFWREFYRGEHLRIAGTAGYRFARVSESLTSRVVTIPPVSQPRSYLDEVETLNRFHGGQIGLTGSWREQKWAVDLSGEVAYGAVFARFDRRGASAIGGATQPGGFFVRPPQTGTFRETHAGLLPSLAAALSRQVTDHGKVFVGYTLHYLTEVRRPGEILGPAGDPGGAGIALLPAAGRSDFWVQGINLGMEWEY